MSHWNNVVCLCAAAMLIIIRADNSGSDDAELKCRQKFPNAKNRISNVTQEDKCFQACLLKQAGIMSCHKTFNVTAMLSQLENDRPLKADERSKYLELIGQCAETEYPGDKCDAAFLFLACYGDAEQKVKAGNLAQMMSTTPKPMN